MNRRSTASLLLCLLCGCAGTEEIGRDAAEIFTVRAGVGLGLRASVRAGALLHPGLGFSVGEEVGWCHGFEYGGLGFELDAAVLHVESVWIDDSGTESRRECACLGLVPPLTERLFPSGSPAETPPYRWIKAGDVEFSVWAVLVGFGFGISFGELLDFITTLFGLDLDPDWTAKKEGPPPLPPEVRYRLPRLAGSQAWRWEDIERLSVMLEALDRGIGQAQIGVSSGSWEAALEAMKSPSGLLEECFDSTWPDVEASALEELHRLMEQFNAGVASHDAQEAGRILDAMSAAAERCFHAR